MINKINSNSGISKIGGGFTGQGKNISQMSANDISIHIMPDVFKKPMQNVSQGHSAKKTGFLILVLGGLMLIGLLVAVFYFFVIKDQPKTVLEDTTPIEVEAPLKNQETKVDPNTKNNEIALEKTQTPEKIIPEQKIDTPSEANQPVSVSGNSPAENVVEKIDNESVVIEEKKIIETPTTTEEKKIEIVPVKSIVIIDIDGDSLSSAEEAIFGTSDQAIDTDGDGYDDISEIFNFYNPSGSGTLEDQGTFTRHNSEKYNTSFLYPSNFEIIALSEDTLALDIGNNELINIFIQENVEKKPIDEWYKELFSIDETSDITAQVISNGEWKGVKSEISLIYYFTDPNKNYIFTFNYSTQAEEYQYKNIFDLIFKSFKNIE